MDFEDITAADLQDDIIAPIVIEECKEQVTKRMNDDGYMNILARYTSSVFQDFESFLRTQIDLVEDDVKLVLDEYNSSFITYELKPAFTVIERFPKLFFKSFNLKIHNPIAKFQLDLMILPEKLNWL